MTGVNRVRALAGCLSALLICHGPAVATAEAEFQSGGEPTREERIRELRARVWEVWVTPLDGELVIDGQIDEPAWEHAEPISEFFQRERNEGLPASERTEVRILYDEYNLYLGFTCYDREMDRLMARALFRDESGSLDDLLVILIDPFNDHRSAYTFATNANGFQIDGLQTGEERSTLDGNWDTVWDAAGSRSPDRWEVEVVLPFKSLRFKPPPDGEEIVFGIGFKRNLRRRNEEDIWPFVSNDSSWYRPAELGHLRGLSQANPGRNVELRPYALGETKRSLELDSQDERGEIGLDAKWGITPAMTADFTINTDFAQEEVDLQQINFTRFSLFFPEKRQFFLEGERMFQFGIRSEADLVFTRRLGLSSEGEVIPIVAGARLSGREGHYTIGAMNIQTNNFSEVPSENFTVLRLRRDMLNRSTIGALFTNRQGGGEHNRLYGADMNLLLGDAWKLEGFFARIDDSEEDEGVDAAYLRFGYDTDRWGTSYRYLDLGENFRPGVGFVRRPNSVENFGDVRFSPRPNSDWIRQLHFAASLRYITDQARLLETRDRLGELTTAFESGDSLTLRYTNRFESITIPFELRP